MPGFDPTILRDEEKVGGFEPETTDDGTFFLEQLPAYPEQTPLKNEASADARNSAVEESAVEEQAEAELPPMEEEPVEQMPLANDTPPPPETKETGILGEPLVLDNSLIDMLKDDLEKSKRKKEEQARAESESPSATSDTEPEFESYAAYAQHQAETSHPSEKGDVVVDLSDIAAEHPSTYGIERKSMQNETQEQASPPQTEKKRRAVWPLITSGVAAVLVLSLLGYFYLIPHGPSIPHNADSTAAGHGMHGQEHANAPTKEHADAHGQEHANTHTAEQTNAHGQGHSDAQAKEHTDTHAKEHADAHGKEQTNTHTAEQTDTHAKEHAHTHEKEKTAQTETAHGSTAHKKDQPTTVAPKEKHGANNAEATIAHAVPHNTPKTHGKTTETKPENKPYKPQMPPPAYARGEYVIQVYASPSADDADEWIEQLRKRKITDGFITSQLVRGQTWYRVRFGKFSTREEAETKASQLGFSNIWIVRIR